MAYNIGIMALTEEQKQQIKEEELYRSQIARNISSPRTSQKHGIPALLSFLIPGLGQIVKGQVGKGIFIFFITIIGYVFFLVPGFIIHLWQVKDAYDG